jgi:hypothetical protein
MRRALQRLAARCGEVLAGARYVNGTEAIDIQRLISPLRYDVVVRKSFFDLLQRERRLYEQDFDSFMEIAERSSYRLWFDRVYCARFDSDLLRNDAAREAAYRKRVRASADLFASFERSGLVPGKKIVLRSGCEILPTDSGKTISAKIFAGDGCHRLALLLKSGATTLRPDQYVVKMVGRYSPLDNTALLLEALDLSSPEYVAFISASFTDKCHNRLEELLDDVATRSPRRLGELRQILSADHLLFHAAH